MAGTTITLNPEGPHSAAYTKEVAASIAEGVRVLNYATRGRDGLEFPSDVAGLVGSVSEAIHGLEQTFRQISSWLSKESEAGRVGEWSEGRYSGDAFSAVIKAQLELDQAAIAARALAEHLREAHAITNALESTGD